MPPRSVSAKKTTRVDYIVLSLEQVTFSLASAGFFGISLFQFTAALFAIYTQEMFTIYNQGSDNLITPSPATVLGNTIGSSVCLIAGSHYQYMRTKIESNSDIVATRYSDWYITTPLMLVEFFNLAGTLNNNWVWLLLSCLSCESMIMCGHFATILKVNEFEFFYMYMASVFFYVLLLIFYVFGTIVDNENQDIWFHFFFFFWTLYPIAFWSKTYKNIAYNILDLYSKGIFGLLLGILTFTDVLR